VQFYTLQYDVFQITKLHFQVAVMTDPNLMTRLCGACNKLALSQLSGDPINLFKKRRALSLDRVDPEDESTRPNTVSKQRSSKIYPCGIIESPSL